MIGPKGLFCLKGKCNSVLVEHGHREPFKSARNFRFTWSLNITDIAAYIGLKDAS